MSAVTATFKLSKKTLNKSSTNKQTKCAAGPHHHLIGLVIWTIGVDSRPEICINKETAHPLLSGAVKYSTSTA